MSSSASTPGSGFEEPQKEGGPWGYDPKLVPAIIFTAAYAILTLVHTFLTVKSRQWWLIVIAVGAAFETAGNGLRIYGSLGDLHAKDPYIAMQVIVVITPALFAAMHFAILGKVLLLFGRRFTLINPKYVIPFFVSLDVTSLFVQAAGSGLAAIADIDGEDPSMGAHIIVGGLGMQLLGYLLFDTLAVYFAYKVRTLGSEYIPAEHWNRKMIIGLAAAFISALFILLRSSFRAGEMIDGWSGKIAKTEWYYYVFDAAPVTAAVLLLAIWHPSGYLPRVVQPRIDEDKEGDVELTGQWTPVKDDSRA